MTTKSLACLVLAVLLGTAMSVRWYLDAEEAVHAAPSQAGRPVVYQHPQRACRFGTHRQTQVLVDHRPAGL